MESIQRYWKRTDKMYLLLCLFSSAMAVLALSSWAAKQGSGFAVDELTGLLGAAARMRPSKSVSDMELKSLKKKFKDKSFAAGVNRDTIRTGCEMLGMELDDVIRETIEGMKENAEALGLKGNL